MQITFKSVNNILLNAGNLKKNEKVLILYNISTKIVADIFYQKSKEITPHVKLLELPIYTQHGIEPAENVSSAMLNADLIICLTQKSLAHTQARQESNKIGVRYLSLPGYSIEMLADESLKVDFKKYLPEVEKLTEIFNEGKEIKITSPSGTNLFLDIQERSGNCCPGFVDENHKLGSPPDIEANIAPNEYKSNGIIVVDGSITCEELGLLKSPVILEIKKGKIQKIESDNNYYKDLLNKIFLEEPKKILAELGVGFNDKAKLCGNMLIDEGAAGYVHFGFGSNSTIGGQNNANFHLDFVIKAPTLYVDGEIIINSGRFVI